MQQEYSAHVYSDTCNSYFVQSTYNVSVCYAAKLSAYTPSSSVVSPIIRKLLTSYIKVLYQSIIVTNANPYVMEEGIIKFYTNSVYGNVCYLY